MNILKNLSSNMILMDINAAGLITNIIGKFGLLVLIGGGVYAIFSMYQYGQSHKEQDPFGKSKAMDSLVGAMAIMLAGFLLRTIVAGWISELFS